MFTRAYAIRPYTNHIFCLRVCLRGLCDTPLHKLYIYVLVIASAARQPLRYPWPLCIFVMHGDEVASSFLPAMTKGLITLWKTRCIASLRYKQISYGFAVVKLYTPEPTFTATYPSLTSPTVRPGIPVNALPPSVIPLLLVPGI